MPSCLVLLFVLSGASLFGASGEARNGEMAGYLIIPHGKVADTYNAGFSMYVAAWPLLEKYAGSSFQSGLPGTWMHPQFEGAAPTNMYTDIEGGLGWWRGTRFSTETPKFHMGGVAPNFSAWANGPGAGKGNDWNDPHGQYGIAQLSPWLLFPLAGLDVKQGECGGLVGYGYLNLPLTTVKPTTGGKDFPTGNNCWTLFLNTRNFKGPVAFFTPYFWARDAIDQPRFRGMMLDTRPGLANRAIQMETQYIPSVNATDKKGEVYARVTPVRFPRGPEGDSVLVHRVYSYNKKALWEAVNAWFAGGPAASGTINPKEADLYTFSGRGSATWSISTPFPTAGRGRRGGRGTPLAWNSFASPVAPDQFSFGYRWDYRLVSKQDTDGCNLVRLPEFYHLVTNANNRAQWVVVQAKDVPPETGLTHYTFRRSINPNPEPCVTPDDPNSCWKKPGPVAGPFKAHLGDGSTVTYYWYRFADQPALLNADLTPQEREELQARVVKLHRLWTKDREYLPPPTVGRLADLDPGQLVTPPQGLEAGYVPIATRQAKED